MQAFIISLIFGSVAISCACDSEQLRSRLAASPGTSPLKPSYWYSVSPRWVSKYSRTSEILPSVTTKFAM